MKKLPRSNNSNGIIAMKKSGQNKIIIVAGVLVVVACFFAVYLRLFTSKELWYESFAAILGVIITAVITLLLLRGQSSNDVEKERSSKIFEEKLRIYQDYLATLCDVLKTKNPSYDINLRLKRQTSYLAMHCDSKKMVEVSTAVKELLVRECADGRPEDRQRSNEDLVLRDLFRIVRALGEDLYGDDYNFDENDKKEILKDFHDAYLEVDSKPTTESVIRNEMSLSDQVSNTQNMSSLDAKDAWESSAGKWKEKGWVLTMPDEKFDGIKVENQQGNPGTIDVGLENGHYYICARYEGDSDFSKALKWEKRGFRSYGTWWNYLPEPYYEKIKEGEFARHFNSDDDGLRKYLADFISYLIDVSDRHHRTALWKQKVLEKGIDNDRWKIYIWYWDMLECEYNDETEGIPYIEVFEENEKISVRISNRWKDSEKLQRTLKRIQCADNGVDAEASVIVEEINTDDAEKVSSHVIRWIERLGQ